MSVRISQQQLESYLWGAATLLRGTIDAGDYKQFIFPLLFYKRLCDVFDEETQAALKESGEDKTFAAYPENHRFQIPQDAHWREVRQVAKNVGHASQKSMRAIETANPDKLYGIFGDAQWTNKDRLSDAMLRNLVEHFSSLDLTIANLPEDELGQGYEYLIKKFADDSGHTAAEFYTNRTVVHLMTEMLQPKPGESIYDPTCGSGGMLLSCITQLRRQGKEWRNVRLYGQERNLMTSSIARMNCFLHGIEDFQIVRGDTLSEPKFVRGDRLMQFDVVLANPPYSIKQWDRQAFASDPWGRNVYGTPPQGRADYAFWQHILSSLGPKGGRCAILFPHGVLFRQEEAEMRRKILEADVVECVIGLGPNLFYNSPMEACVVLCRTAKPKTRNRRILLINALNEVTRDRAQSFLTEDHIQRIVAAYNRFEDVPGFTRVVSLPEVRTQGGNLNISLFVTTQAATHNGGRSGKTIKEGVGTWLESKSKIRASLAKVIATPTMSTNSVSAEVDFPSWLNRTEWKRMPFGAIADSINDRVEPADAADENYVGLDHLDPQDLHIRRWGKGSDVIGTKLRFRKGDIVFGRRRAYQRKLAVAEMDGICSAHAMVVRAKREIVLPELLPFLMTSDKFMNRAVEISVGSLSPTINWSTLKLQEFGVPPIGQQRHIIQVLSALEECEDIYLQLIRASDESAKVVVAEAAKKKGVNRVPLAELISSGPQNGLYRPASDYGTGCAIVRIDSFYDGRISTESKLERVNIGAEDVARYGLKNADVLINRVNSIEFVGKCALVQALLEPTVFESNIMRFSVDQSRIDTEFLIRWMCLDEFRKHILARAKHAVNQASVNQDDVRSAVIPVPELSEQRLVIRRVLELEDISKVARDVLSAMSSLRSQILSHLWPLS